MNGGAMSQSTLYNSSHIINPPIIIILISKFFSLLNGTKSGYRIFTDMHAHFLPAIDDGPATMQETIEMLKAFRNAGFSQLTATPHVFQEYYPNDRQQITDRFLEVQFALKKHKIQLQLNIAAEYYLDSHFMELLGQDDLLVFPSNHVLVECSMLGPTPNLSEYLFAIHLKGLRPILAHPERYMYMQEADYQYLAEQGNQFQVNLLSLAGHYGSEVRKRAVYLLKKFPVQYLGTDAHKVNHIKTVQKFLKSSRTNKLLRNKTIFNEQLFQVNPQPTTMGE